jgi:hypothetical protein
LVRSPTSGLDVDVALASAHLGAAGCTHDESTGLRTQSCAALPPDASVGTGLCGGPCDYSKIQLSFKGGTGGSTAHVTISKAAILDAVSGAELQSLNVYTPLVWNGVQYVAWDENIAPSSDLKTSYTLSPPNWTGVDPTNSYSRKYRVRVDLSIDGALLSLESDVLTRDPPVAT